jgi:hypothetical protein
MISYNTLSGLLATIIHIIRFIEKSLSPAPQNNINPTIPFV